MTNDKYDCMRCGACCSHYNNIPILPNEVKEIDKRLLIYIMPSPLQSDGLSMKFVEGTKRCVGLEGIVGQSVKCSVYDIRPPVCRRFEPGSDLCKKVRFDALNIID